MIFCGANTDYIRIRSAALDQRQNFGIENGGEPVVVKTQRILHRMI
ncbi:MAG: hypothetical protein K6A61_12235 [Butyrivibrio sp.]|nr:hypothetical protein [Butyrivibrio sp.]